MTINLRWISLCDPHCHYLSHCRRICGLVPGRRCTSVSSHISILMSYTYAVEILTAIGPRHQPASSMTVPPAATCCDTLLAAAALSAALRVLPLKPGEPRRLASGMLRPSAADAFGDAAAAAAAEAPASTPAAEAAGLAACCCCCCCCSAGLPSRCALLRPADGVRAAEGGLPAEEDAARMAVLPRPPRPVAPAFRQACSTPRSS
jgi:hypothetical protein